MIRVAVVADSHFDETSRFAECVRVHEWIAKDIRDREVSLVLHAGDVFEARSTPRERAAVADWFCEVASFAPVVVVAGNHDAPGDIEYLSRLRTQHPIHAQETPSLIGMPVGVADEIVEVCCLPWPRKAHLMARMPGGHSATDAQARASLVSILRGFQPLLDQPRERPLPPRILLAHAMVSGSTVSTGQPLVGCDFELAIEELALATVDVVALGHIHKGQHWTWRTGDTEVPLIYPGSPRRTSFGESETKGYVVIELGASTRPGVCAFGMSRARTGVPQAEVSWSRVETPARAMVLLSGEYVVGDDGRGRLVLRGEGQQVSVNGAEVRLRYNVRAHEREAGRRAAGELADAARSAGAVSVVTEEVVAATSTARAPEVTTAVTLTEKLTAFWRSRALDLEASRHARLLSMVRALEDEMMTGEAAEVELSAAE